MVFRKVMEYRLRLISYHTTNVGWRELFRSWDLLTSAKEYDIQNFPSHMWGTPASHSAPWNNSRWRTASTNVDTVQNFSKANKPTTRVYWCTGWYFHSNCQTAQGGTTSGILLPQRVLFIASSGIGRLAVPFSFLFCSLRGIYTRCNCAFCV